MAGMGGRFIEKLFLKNFFQGLEAFFGRLFWVFSKNFIFLPSELQAIFRGITWLRYRIQFFHNPKPQDLNAKADCRRLPSIVKKIDKLIQNKYFKV